MCSSLHMVDGFSVIASSTSTSLRELAALFLRLGATAFGGPAAHIAMMQAEVVGRKKWMTDERFLDLLGATNLIPGPNSTELAIHIGFERRRWAGLVVAGLCFIVPAMLATGALAWAYVEYGTLPQAGWLMYGIKPVILAVVVQAIAALAPKAAHSARLRALAAASVVAVVLGAHELLVLLAAGVLAIAARPRGPAALLIPLAPVLPAVASAVTLPGLFGVFFKIGSVLFGSGYVLLALLRADLVQRLGWLTEAQLIDAVAAGQVTPGPVFTTATFIGYLLHGPAGAGVATLGIFCPAFLFVALSGPLVPRLRASNWAGSFLDGVNVASLALMAVVTVQLGQAAIVDWPTAALALGSAVVLLLFKPNATWVIGLGAAAGFLLHAAAR